jgi:hypothetical protein
MESEHLLRVILYSLLLMISVNLLFGQLHDINITSYDIDIEYDAETDTLKVVAQIGIKKPPEEKSIFLYFSSRVDINRIGIYSGNNSLSTINYEYIGQDSLLIHLPKEKVKAENITLDFDYALRAYALENSMAFFRREYRWYPLLYGESSYWRISAIVPKEHKVVSVGRIVSEVSFPDYEKITWKTDIPLTSFPLIIFSTDIYEETIMDVYDIPVTFYFYSADSVTVNGIISQICESFKFYNDFLGEYAHNQLTFVELPPPLEFGQSLGSLVMAGGIFVEYFTRGFNGWPAHEVGHEWIGHGIFFEPYAKGRGFVEESLTEYLRLMYIEHSEGEEALKETMYEALERYKAVISTERDIPILDIHYPMGEYAMIIHTKGPYIIHKLRKSIGDENWHNLLREMYDNFLGKFFTYHDFEELISKYDDDGTILSSLRKNLTTKGIPSSNDNIIK